MSVNAIGTRVLRTPKLPEDDALRPFIAIVELLVVNFFNDEFERLESLDAWSRFPRFQRRQRLWK